jgi:Toprim domain
MTRDLTIADLKALLLERLDGLVAELVPGAHSKAAHFEARSPLRTDRSGGSFIIWRRGKGAGAWKDFASDDKGDVLDLIACAACGANCPPTKEERVAAIKWAKAWLGLAAEDPAARARVRERAKRQATDAQKRDEEARRQRRRRAFDLWIGARDWRDTIVETYLRARGIFTERLENLDDGVRFMPRLDHWTEHHTGPAMLAAFRHPVHGFCGLHATFLRPDGSGKADVDKPKLMLGQVSGCALRLTRGESALTLTDAERAGVATTLVLTEGIEDGLSVAAARPDLRVWAAGSLGNLGAQPSSPAIASYLICADNDWEKPAAMAAFEKARAALQKHGTIVAVARAHRGKDMNDLAREGLKA